MSKSLPIRPHLDHLKKQSKELLAAFQLGDQNAHLRFNQWHPRGQEILKHPENVSLSDAQLTLSREYGFESWVKLKFHVEKTTESPLHLAIQSLKQGKMCILFDDESRENEGDLVIAAEKVSADAINFITKHGRGTLCLSLTGSQTDQLGLRLINSDMNSIAEPAFTVSIDAANGVTTGVSALDRAKTVLTAIHDSAGPKDVRSPGHIFPLRSHPDGIHGRRGHTEGSVELMRLAGLKPAAVICEILNDDGTMARWEDVKVFGEKFNIPVVQISDLLVG